MKKALILVLLGGTLAWGAPVNLLRNPGFEAGLQDWQHFGTAERYRPAPHQGKQGAGLSYQKDRATAKEENSHLDQLVPVRPGTLYVAGMDVRILAGSLRPGLRIAGEDWNTIVWQAAVPGDTWQRVEVPFITPPDAAKIRFQIFGGAQGKSRQTRPGKALFDNAFVRLANEEETDAFFRVRVHLEPQKPLSVVKPLFFGVNALFTVEDDAALAGGRLAAALRQLPCRLLRYPGGDMADNYHWKTHSLDNPAIWPQRQGDDTTDTEEFMAFRRQVGAEAIFVVNLESCLLAGDLAAGAREAAAWVRACNIEHDTPVRYWEIGNETYLYNPGPGHRHKRIAVSAADYARAFLAFSKAMKAVDKTIKCGAVGPINPAHHVRLGAEKRDPDAWWPRLLQDAGDAIDFAVIHQYFPAEYGRPVRAPAAVSTLRDLLASHSPDRHIPLALTEWNLNKHAEAPPLEAALLLTEAAVEYMRNGVEMACFWPLRYRRSVWQSRALLSFTEFRPLPRFTMLQFLATTAGERMLSTSIDGQGVYAAAFRREATWRILLISRAHGPRATHVTIDGLPPNRQHLQGRALLPQTGSTPRWNPRSLDIRTSNQGLELDLPSRSAAMVSFESPPL